jgi:hypothetical protein
MLANLSIGVWGIGKSDKEVTKTTNNNYGAGTDAGNYTKKLVKKAVLKPINDIVSSARAYHKDHTLPWQDRGGRLLPAKKHTEYTSQMRYYKTEFELAVRTFIDNDFTNAISDAQNHLGQMFDANDYPSQADVEGKFKFEISIDPVPTEDDFRTSLSENEINQLKADLVKREKTRQAAAMQDIRQRIIDVLNPFVEKLSDPKSRVYEAYIANAANLADILPSLNLDKDPAIDTICQEIKAKLCQVSAKDLRKDATTKKQVSDDAKKIRGDIMDAYNLTGTSNQAVN